MLKNNALETSAEDASRAQTADLDDPYSGDFFAQNVVAAIEPAEADETDSTAAASDSADSSAEKFDRAWHLALPRVTTAEAVNSNVLTAIAPDLAANLLKVAADSLTECATNNQGVAACEAIALEEADLLVKAEALTNEQTIFFDFAVEPQRTRGVLTLDADFAVKAIKKSFGFEAGETEKRALSANELAVAEFFALNCLSRINKWVAEPLFRLQSVAQTAPDWLRDESDDAKQTRGLFCKIKVALDDAASVAQLFLPFALLENLSAANNPLLVNRAADKRELTRFVSSVRVRASLGETDLNSGDLAAIEVGDVILIERPAVEFAGRNLTGSVAARIGSERAASLYGDLTTGETLGLALSEVSQNNETGGAIRFRMQDDEQTEETNFFETNDDDANGANAGLALEKIAITLRAEIASRRITLDELANLRLNQIIELGARPTDPIELSADGKTIAIGELVNIEDQLGVRLTKILL